jgi:hypothetical protein
MNMLRTFRNKAAILLIAIMPFSMASCDEEGNFDLNKFLEILMGMLGWDPTNENTDIEDLDPYEPEEIEDSGAMFENYFPPIGNQGSYGTCVTWATGYALKTALDKKDNSNLDVTKPINQVSPVDLWHLIDNQSKNANCDGTNFDPAFTAMLDKGVANMNQVPFTNSKMQCEVSGQGNSSNKLGSYRIIAYTNELSGTGTYGMTVENFKGYLEKNMPIAIGARLGERFMNWNNSSVLSYDTEKVQGQHAYHAVVLVGYDNNRNAFRLRNSWGPTWGDNGSIWIDYDHFINNFCFGAWIASNSKDISSGLRTESPSDIEVDLIKDYEVSNGERIVEYNIKNTGNVMIRSNENWSVVYLLFRANRLSEKYLLFHDYYGNESRKGEIAPYADGVAVYPSANTITNTDIPAGSSVAESMGGHSLAFSYVLPLDKSGNKLNGDFYLVMVADAFGKLDESDKKNNIRFITGRNGEPLKIQNGNFVNMPTRINELHTLVSDSDKNNYSGEEIQQALERQMKNGSLKKFILQENGLRNIRIPKQVK